MLRPWRSYGKSINPRGTLNPSEARQVEHTLAFKKEQERQRAVQAEGEKIERYLLKKEEEKKRKAGAAAAILKKALKAKRGL